MENLTEGPLDEDLILQDQFNQLLGTASLSNRYTSVTALIVYWKESDHVDEYRREAKNLGEFFHGRLKFNVEYFRIPPTSSQRELRSCIDKAVLGLEQRQKFNDKCLLLIHYGGHGDRDDDYHNGELRRSVWCANRSGGPSVQWYDIQQSFSDVQFDILLLLDCCYGAQAARGRERRAGKIELLAAASSREETPAPGAGSFTSAMIRNMEYLLENDGYISVIELHTRLSHRRADLYTTPWHGRLRIGSSERSIRLQPVEDTAETQDWAAAIRVLIQTTEQLDSTRIEQIVSWLQADAPPIISRLQAEKVLLRTNKIGKFIATGLCNREGILAETLKEYSLDDIREVWYQCQELIRQYCAQHNNTSNIIGPRKTAQLARQFLEKLDAGNTKMIESLEADILLSPAVSRPEVLEGALHDPAIGLLGIQEELELRRIIVTSVEHQKEEEADTTSTPAVAHRSLLEEYKEYGETRSPDEVAQIEDRVKLLARLLSSEKRAEFGCLRLEKWEHRPFEHRFVYHFQIPPFHDADHQTLYKIIKEPWRGIRPSLGERFTMAYHIAKAVYQWHMVQWVHQGINGHNIVFFPKTGQKIVDFSTPHLQGFDFARPNAKPSTAPYVEDIRLDVYRHPDRQGPSRDGHTKIHDLYSLGVVLLEIGLWRRAVDIIKDGQGSSKETSNMSKEKMFNILKDAASRRLHHHAGKRYQEAVLCCLKSKFGGNQDDISGPGFAAAVRGSILENLTAWKFVD